MIVLDSSALLAMLYREPGCDAVYAVFDDSCVSTVNLAEVLSRFARDGEDFEGTYRRFSRSRMEIIPFTSELALVVASLFPATRRFGLSLGDRACLALAIERRVPVMTADRVWASLAVGVTVTVIR